VSPKWRNRNWWRQWHRQSAASSRNAEKRRHQYAAAKISQYHQWRRRKRA
jgi:hypothetical protein